MALIQEQIPNLINGVSQQPPSQRLSTQCEDQQNCIVSLAEGLKKRPPTEHLGKIDEHTDNLAYVHTINRDATERFKVVLHSEMFSSEFTSEFTTTSFEVHDLSDGSNVPITNFSGDVKTYLTLGNPRDDIKMLTISDYTFIVNKSVATAKSTSQGATRAPEGIIFLKQAALTNPAAGMKVFVDGDEVASVTNLGAADSNVEIDELYDDLVDSIGSGGTNLYTITKFEQSNVHITRINGADFTLHAQAPSGNMIAIKDVVNDFTDLPKWTKDGFIVKVTGDPGSNVDDYWLKHVNAGDVDTGAWEETVEPGLYNTIDPATMPIKLVRTAPGFNLAQITWTPRVTGDVTTAPDPSFIGEKIKDIFFYKNRFGVLAGENVILSEIGEFFNFYFTTATDLLDTDPIDLSAPSNDVNILHGAVVHDRALIVYSDRAQFEVKESSTTGLTPAVAILEEATQFLNTPLVHPIVVGTKIYFAETRDGYSTVREFGVQEDLTVETAEDITSHIPGYIEGNITRIIAAGSDNTLFALSDTTLNDVYVYKFLITNGQKQLSSWGRWVFPEDHAILDIGNINSILSLTIKRPDGTYIETMSMQTSNIVGRMPSSTSLDFKVLLDRLTTITGTYDSGTDLTTFTVPYVDDTTLNFVYGPAFDGLKGSLVQGLTKTSTTTYTHTGDLSAGIVWCGRPYWGIYEFTEPSLKVQLGGKPNALEGGRLSVRKFSVKYFDTPYFEVVVSSPARDDTTYVFTRIAGSPNNILGDIAFETGSFTKTIMRNSENLSIKLKSDSYLPFTFTSALWVGSYTNRAQTNVSRRV